MRGVKDLDEWLVAMQSESGPSPCGGTGRHTGVSVYSACSLQLLPSGHYKTRNDSVVLVNRPG